MTTDVGCFLNQCGAQSKACFTNPSCLKGVTCLGNCRGEQECATRCFARFGSEKLDNWLSCTLEDEKCISTPGVAQDISSIYRNPPRTKAMARFQPKDLEGTWYKVLGLNPKYDLFPCQQNSFRASPQGSLDSESSFRIRKPDGGAWQNRLAETLVPSPSGPGSLTVEGKMFGLKFQEEWYVLGQGDDWRALVYRGGTLQGPYEGGFVLAREKDAFDERLDPGAAARRKAVDALLLEAGLGQKQFAPIDNACPAEDVTQAGVSGEEAGREKLAWSDVFALAEWIRPGTLAKPEQFDPNQM
jgi:hypothetical protein